MELIWDVAAVSASRVERITPTGRQELSIWDTFSIGAGVVIESANIDAVCDHRGCFEEIHRQDNTGE